MKLSASSHRRSHPVFGQSSPQASLKGIIIMPPLPVASRSFQSQTTGAWAGQRKGRGTGKGHVTPRLRGMTSAPSRLRKSDETARKRRASSCVGSSQAQLLSAYKTSPSPHPASQLVPFGSWMDSVGSKRRVVGIDGVWSMDFLVFWTDKGTTSGSS